ERHGGTPAGRDASCQGWATITPCFSRTSPVRSPIASFFPVHPPTRHAVVMAGGSGTRFWPRSRHRVPKQLLPIATRKTLLADTLARVRSLATPRATWIVTGASHAAAVRREARGLPRGNVLVEPQ